MIQHGHNRFAKVQSRKFIGKKRTRAVVVLVLILVSCVSWVFALSRLSLLGIFRITSIEIVGASPEIAGTLRASAISALEGKYLNLFSKSNIVIYPKSSVLDKMASSSMRVKSLVVERNGLNGLSVFVEEKVPLATVCAKLPDEIPSQATSSLVAKDNLDLCYVADSTGLIFDKATTSVFLDRFYAPDLYSISPNSAIGLYATSTIEFGRLKRLYGGLGEHNMRPYAILIKGGGEYEAYVDLSSRRNESTGTTVLYFNNSMTFDDQLSNLVAFWEKIRSEANSGNKHIGVDYIDLRYGDNIFYRATTE